MKLMANCFALAPFSDGNLRSSAIGEGEAMICSRIMINCAMIHRMFMCGPYAIKKSHRIRTSGSGGVHADSVITARMCQSLP